MEALNIIAEDHRALWRLTTALAALNGDMREQGAVGHIATMNLMLDYIEDYVQRVHHPKEDQFLFPKLLLRRPELAPVVERQQVEHVAGPKYLHQIRQKGEAISRGNRIGEAAFFADIDRLIRRLRAHIHAEDQELLPAARECLTAADWAEIDAPFLSETEPLFGRHARAEFAELRTRLVLSAPEPVGLGSHDYSAEAFEYLKKGEPLLSIRGLSSHYGRIQALYGVDMEIREGELVALVGANGAGKTTLLHTLSGVQGASGGAVHFDGHDITRLSPHERVKRGICQSPEGRRVFGPLTIEDNLRLGGYTRSKVEVTEDMERMYELFPILREKRHLPAGTLSGGQQQMLAMARALMGKPRLLLLDEPSMGLAPLLVDEIFRVIGRLKARGMTILLVEQNAHAALSIADHGYVIEAGRTILSGPGPELLENEDVQKAYLGM